jgi:hypothetical protein
LTFPDFEEFVASLNARHVRYLIVGGYAVGFHARPRATKDIDVLVDSTTANARRVVASLTDFFGAPPSGVSEVNLTNPRTLVVLGIAPVRIDILTSIDGISSFAAAWKRRVKSSLGTVPALFIGFDDLLASKLASGRPQDLADAALLQRVRSRRRVHSKPPKP